MGLLNLSVFLLVILRFLLFLYRQRRAIGFPDLPDRVDDTMTLSALTRDFFPKDRSTLYMLRMVLDWKDCRTLVLSSQEGQGAREQDRFARGVYILRSFELILQEKFGLFKVRLQGETGRMMTVYPAGGTVNSIPVHRRHSRNTPDPKKSLLKENSFYESRLYSPGDDPRRINWKLKARHGDLFVKDGYSATAEGKAILLILNGRGSFRDVDRLMRECRIFWDHLTEQNFPVSILVSGSKRVVRIPPDFSEEKREDCLASVPPALLVIETSVFAVSYGAVYLFSVEETLPPVPVEVGSAPKDKILITVPSDEEGSGDISSLAYGTRGWRVYEV